MTERRTNAGKLLDMEVLMAEHETVIAVGSVMVIVSVVEEQLFESLTVHQ